MRGAVADVNRGIAPKDSPFLAPIDRFVGDPNVTHSQAQVVQGQNEKFNLYTRREVPIQVNQFPQTTANEVSASTASVLQNNGVVPLPNAGIFRRT